MILSRAYGPITFHTNPLKTAHPEYRMGTPTKRDASTVKMDGKLKVTGVGLPPAPTIAPVTVTATNLVVTVPTVTGGQLRDNPVA